jgi:hypothetical protein
MSARQSLEGEQRNVIRGSVRTRKCLTPRQAIHEHCIDCIGGPCAIRNCDGHKLADGPCIFFSYRMGAGRPPVRLIRKFCLYCMGGSRKLVRECSSTACAFLPYRMGKNPAMANRRVPLNSRKRPRHGAVFSLESTNEASLDIPREGRKLPNRKRGRNELKVRVCPNLILEFQP